MLWRWLLVGMLAGLGVAGQAAASPGTTVPPGGSTTTTTTTTSPPPVVVADPATGLPAARGPLVVVPAECAAPAPAVVVFEGTVVDAVATTARFQVGRVLAGSVEGRMVNGRVDVRFDDETRFLLIGTTYLVGARLDTSTGLLVSGVREPAPLFGGDAVVGRNDNDVKCPVEADPARTLQLDGNPVDTGVLAPLTGSGRDLARAVLLPVAIAFGIVVVLVLLKHLLFAVGRSLRDLGAPEESPRRTRRHGISQSSS
jgi:hypothetical protein